MATATITVTPDVRQSTNYSMKAQASHGMKREVGIILFNGGTYLDGGIAFAPKIGTGRLVGIMFFTLGADQGGRIFTWDNTNFKIQAYEAGTGGSSFDECDSGADVLSETLMYIAIGY